MDREGRIGGRSDPGALDPTMPDTLRSGPRPTRATPLLAELGVSGTDGGVTIDRFVVTELLGAGGMGVVLAAHDPDLDRKVALKLLRPDPGSRTPTIEQRARALREAQAMARLSHPNVITVHDVGAVSGSVYIAMELVDGATLREHLAGLPAGPRRWRAVLDVVIDAGRGLAAAHAAGLVHRDFKPDNVLVGRDGRVRVTDFGLVAPITPSPSPRARPTAAATPSPAPAPSRTVHAARGTTERGEEDRGREAAHLTRDGAIVGTPHYMAPEQRAGRPLDARADQYAFCLVLLEALGGMLARDAVPTVAGGHGADARRTVRYPDCRAVRVPDVPRWLARAIARGLAADPAARYPSMDALLAELTRDRTRRARWLVAGAAAAAVAAIALAVIATRPPAVDDGDTCAARARALAGAWDTVAAARVRATLLAGGAPYGEATWRETRRLLDGYGAELTAMRAEACRATRVERAQPRSVLDLRAQCLERRREALAATIARLAEPGATARAAELIAALPAVADCADHARLTARTPLPGDAAARARIAAVATRLDAIRARRLAGQLRELDRDAAALVDDARALGHAPVLAAALLELGLVRVELDGAAAGHTLREAIAVTGRAHDGEVEADAWTQLLYVESELRGAPADAEAWLPLARAAVEALAGDRGRHAELPAMTALIALRLGRLAEARTETAGALAERRAALGDDHPLVASMHNLVALAARAAGDRDDAIAHQRAALAIRLRLGDEHPAVADSRGNLALALRDAGRYAEALAEQDRALAIRRRVYGDDHLEIAAARNNRAMTLQDLGRTEEAAAEYAAALALHERHLEPDHLRIAAGHNNLGLALHDLGRDREAADHLRRALAARARRLPAGHVDVAVTWGNLGRAQFAAGDREAGLAELGAAVDALERALGERHPTVAYWLAELGSAAATAGRVGLAADACRRSLTAAIAGTGDDGVDAAYGGVCVGRGELLLGHPAAAADALARAVDVLVASEEMPYDVAEARFLLARALAAAGRDRAHARALARAARAGYQASDNPDARVAEVDAWLRR
jgi:tetratricopeptide (TPR) repeat protein